MWEPRFHTALPQFNNRYLYFSYSIANSINSHKKIKTTPMILVLFFSKEIPTFTLIKAVDTIRNNTTCGVTGSRGDDRDSLVPSVAHDAVSQAPVSVPLALYRHTTNTFAITVKTCLSTRKMHNFYTEESQITRS